MNKTSVVIDRHTVSYWKYQLIDKLYKELVLQQKYLKREDTRNAKKSNQLLLRLLTLLEQEMKNNEIKSKKGL